MGSEGVRRGPKGSEGVSRLLEELLAQRGLVELEAVGDALEVPHRVDGALDDLEHAVGRKDVAVGREAPRLPRESEGIRGNPRESEGIRAD